MTSKKQLEGLLSVIRTIDSQTDLDSLFETLCGFAQLYGFKTTSILPFINPASGTVNIWKVGRSNLPKEFQSRWVNNRYLFHDPISRYAQKTKGAFEWGTAREHADRFGREIFDQARDIHLKNGLAVPIFFGNYPTGIVSLGHDNMDLSPQDIAKIELVAVHSYIRLIKVTGLEEKIVEGQLTPREVDVLYYVSAGKTNWEIAKILGIGIESVKQHMKNINHKMGATNRAHSVAKAIQSGQIVP